MQTNITIQINKTKLAAAAIFAAKKDIRYYLNGVCLEIGNNGARLVATDGHAMIIINLLGPVTSGTETLEKPIQVILSNDDIKRFKPVKSRNAFANEITVTVEPKQSDGKQYIKVYDNGATFSFPAIDGHFPDYRRVFPRTISGEAAQYNPNFLVKAHDAALMLGYKNPCVNVGHNGPKAALVDIGAMDEVAIVLMPMRTEEKVNGAFFEWVMSDLTKSVSESVELEAA